MHRNGSEQLPEQKGARSEFIASESFALRTPALAWDELLQLDDGALGAGPAAHRTLRERLTRLFERVDIREAIYVASPGLHDRLALWQREPDSPQGQELELALVRYLLRMATRATPFGLFSGVGSGAIAGATWLEVPPRTEQVRRSRVDNEVLFELGASLARDATAQRALTFRPNSSLYRSAGRLRYAEARPGEAAREYHLVTVEPSPYLEASLERARAGARLDELATALVEGDPEISLEEAREFISALVDTQLLVPDLGVSVTGEEPLDAFLGQLAQARLGEVGERMTQVKAALGALDARGPGAATSGYGEIRKALEGLPVALDDAKLVQVDLVRPSAGNRLGRAVVKEVLLAVDVLRRITPRGADPLADWKAAFRERYDQRRVPLAEVLDEENGIGWSGSGTVQRGTPLLAGLHFPLNPDRASLGWSGRDRLLLAKLMGAASTRAREIALDAADIEALAAAEPARLPDAWASVVRVAAASSEAIDRGEFSVLVQGASGPSGAEVLGRFCHASSEIEHLVRQHLKAEEANQPDAIFAEVAHLPHGRTGNILCRPVLRDHEIVFLGTSGATPERQIPITDLEVELEGERVVLRSRRLGREVIPRLTSAHNVLARGLGLYRFLYLLQSQGSSAWAWSWGGLGTAPYLPRVRVGRAVLCRAQWWLSSGEIAPLSSALRSGDRARCHAAVQELRARRDLPRMVAIADGDNELSVDLDSALCSRVFADTLAGRSEAAIIEQFPTPDQLCVRGPGGRFTHELVLSFTRKPAAGGPVEAAAQDFSAEVAVERASPPRSLTLGSGCLYLKLYAGTATAERLLTELVAPVAAAAIASGDASHWFFVRYHDPRHHLRVRFFGEPSRLATRVLPAIEAAAAPFREQGAVWRQQVDTYEREVERYGGPAGIELVERVFWLDSEATLELLQGVGEESDGGPRLADDVRWLVALRGVDQLLADLGLSERGRLGIYTQLQDNLDREHRTGTEFHRQLGARYRARQADIERALGSRVGGGAAPGAAPLERAAAILARRSARLAPIVSELIARDAAGLLRPRLDAGLQGSVVHMHVNRLLQSAQRSQELVLYTYLRRFYAGLIARREHARRRADAGREGKSADGNGRSSTTEAEAAT